MLLIEVGLRWAYSCGQLDGWLYMSGVQTKYSDVADLDELLRKHHRAYPPNRVP